MKNLSISEKPKKKPSKLFLKTINKKSSKLIGDKKEKPIFQKL